MAAYARCHGTDEQIAHRARRGRLADPVGNLLCDFVRLHQAECKPNPIDHRDEADDIDPSAVEQGANERPSDRRNHCVGDLQLD